MVNKNLQLCFLIVLTESENNVYSFDICGFYSKCLEYEIISRFLSIFNLRQIFRRIPKLKKKYVKSFPSISTH